MLRRSFYHFVNSPVGIFVQNALVIVWVFVYPSLFTMLLLLCSTINMMCVKASDIEGYVVISPQLWTQRIFIVYGLLLGVVYYVLSSGIAVLLEGNVKLYYLLLGGLKDFKHVNWFVDIVLVFMGWFTIVAARARLNRRCPATCRRRPAATPST